MTNHDLRARTLINRDDPRIRRALRAIPPDQRTASPDAAYYQAALIVAERDARAELAHRNNPRWYRVGYVAGIVLMLATAAAIVYGLVHLIW